MQTQHRPSGPRCSSTRSRISNGSLLLAGVDGRSSTARRYRDLVRAFEEEIGGQLSPVEKGLVTQAAALTLRSEQLQADIVNGKAVSSDELIRLTGTARRILTAISAKASKRQASAPSPLEQYLGGAE